MHQIRSSAHGIERETAGIAEHIQYVPSLSVVFQQMTVLTLVDKETGFLSLEPVHMEFQSVFHGDILRTASLDETVLGSQQIRLERQGCFRLVVNVLDYIPHHFAQSIGNFHAIDMHAGRMSLHDRRMIVNVNDQSRQVIAFSVYQTIGIVLRVTDQSQSTAQILGHLQTAYPERMVNGFLTERKHTHRNASHLEMTTSYKFFL